MIATHNSDNNIEDDNTERDEDGKHTNRDTGLPHVSELHDYQTTNDVHESSVWCIMIKDNQCMAIWCLIESRDRVSISVNLPNWKLALLGQMW